MPTNKNLRLVIDTNLWISFIISKKFSEIEGLLFSTKSRILFSAEIIEELEVTIQKPKLKKYFAKSSVEEMMNVFDDYIDFVEVNSKINACRDFKDNFLLSLAKDGKADYLLTGDKDLLVLNPFENTKIITYSEFQKFIKTFESFL